MAARVASVIAGIWLMAAPHVLGYAGAMRASDRIVGPIVVAVSVVAAAEVARPLRWIGLLAGAWLLIAPALLRASYAARIDSAVVGLLLVGCALVRGRAVHTYGGGWRAVLRPT